MTVDPRRLRELAGTAKARERAEQERREQEWARGAPERARKKVSDEDEAYEAILKLVVQRIEAAATSGQTRLDSFLWGHCYRPPKTFWFDPDKSHDDISSNYLKYAYSLVEPKYKHFGEASHDGTPSVGVVVRRIYEYLHSAGLHPVIGWGYVGGRQHNFGIRVSW